MKKFAEPLIHLLIWLSFYLVAIMFVRTIGPFSRIDGTLLWPVTIGTIINVIMFFMVSLWLIPSFLIRRKRTLFWVGITLIFLVFNTFETGLDFFFLQYSYSNVDEPFSSQFLINGIIHLVIVSLALGYGFTRHWVVSEQRRQQLSKEKLTAELSFLKTQLNPHFLFNVLNMAYSSANRSGDDQTADIIERLSGMMRYMVYESNAERVPVEKEVGFIRNYIELQQMRFSGDMPVTVDVQLKGSYQGKMIAPLILIPFIENAFKYGVKLEQPSVILISLQFSGDEMEFLTQNPIFNTKPPTNGNSSGVGIQNTRKRLEIMYKDKFRLTITNTGDAFHVKLWMNLV